MKAVAAEIRTVQPRVAPPMRTPTEEEVWSTDPVGTPWCDCGSHHALTKEFATQLAREMFGDELPETISHIQLIDLSAWAWQYVEVCDFFIDRVGDAAVEVNGAVADGYPLGRGLAILRQFSNNWHGCPMEGCGGGFIPNPPENPNR